MGTGTEFPRSQAQGMGPLTSEAWPSPRKKEARPSLLPGGLWPALVMVLLLLLVACAPTAPTTQPGAPKEVQPKYGGVMVVAAKAAPPNLHPYMGTGVQQKLGMGPAAEPLLNRLGEPGKNFDAVAKLVPWLAESWEQPNDTTYIFKMRKGVKWHDGEAFTAEDVAFSYEHLRDKKNAFGLARHVAALDTIQVLDPYTVKMTLHGPSPYFLRDIADPNIPIIPKHIADRGGDFKKTLIGTGPFKLKSADLAKENVFVRFEDYWQKGKPYLDGVSIPFGMEKSARLAAFIAGQNDLIELGDKAELDALLKVAPKAQYEAAIGAFGNALYPKIQEAPWSDIRVRRAVHLAVDRQEMIKTLTYGQGVINPPAIPGNLEGWAIPQEELLKLPGYRQPKDQDLAEAKRLLAEAGYPNGFKFRAIYSKEFATTPKIIEMFAGQMKRIGIDMTLDGTDSATYKDKSAKGIFEVDMVFAGRFDFWSRARSFLHSTGAENTIGVNDPELDKLLDIILYNVDEKARKKATLDLQRALLEKLYIIPTIELATYPTWQPWVKDILVGDDYVSWHFDAWNNTSGTWIDVDQLPGDRR